VKFKGKSIIILSIALFILSTINGNAQEMLGVTLGNYSGSAGLMLNPAGMTTNKVFLDINLVTADVFVKNNFAYIPADDISIWEMFKQGYEFPTYGKENRNVLYYKNEDLKNTVINTRVLGPSAMLQVGDHAFGITTGVRYLMTGNRIPWDVAEISYNGLDYTPLHNIEFDDYDVDLNTNAWMEIGLSYAYDIYKSYDQQLTVGISLKKLWGYSGGYVSANNVNYLVVNDSTINIKNLNAEVGFSLPVDYDNNDFISTGSTFRGSGIGLDIGAVFVKKRNVSLNKWRGKELCSQTYDDYIYRIGVSILDIGRVKYTTNTQLHNFDDVSQYWTSVDTISFDNINTLFGQLSETFYDDPSASLISNSIKIGLPTALSLQFDFNFQNNIYLGGMWIHPLRINMHTLRRPAQVALVPRYETKYFELSIPVSLYEYQYPRVGIAARFYFITIGTERLGTYLGMADMNGIDIYASIKIGINKGSCKSKFGGACSNQNFGNNNRRR
jgi:hypothetical protein